MSELKIPHVITSFQSSHFIIHDITKVPVTLPPFYKLYFYAWSDLDNVPLSFQETVNEITWNNKFLCVDKKIAVFPSAS